MNTEVTEVAGTPQRVGAGRLESATLLAAMSRVGLTVGIIVELLLTDRGTTAAGWTTFAVHAAGSIATVVVLVMGRPGAMLMGLAFTGYSTVSLALTAPNLPLAVLVWATGLLTVAGLAMLLLEARRTSARAGVPPDGGPRPRRASGLTSRGSMTLWVEAAAVALAFAYAVVLLR